MGINMLDMKQSNARTVLSALYSCKTATIKEIAMITGLSFATVGNILNSFVESGEVILGEMHSTTGGRPSQAYSFHGEYAHVLAISAQVRDGKNILFACIGNLYRDEVWKTEQSFEVIRLSSFETMLDLCLTQYPSIRIVSFSLPGVERDGVIVMNDYKELEGLAFSEHFQKKYQIQVIIENDVNAAILGYGKQLSSLPVIVGIYFPKQFPPGAGIMIDGKVLKGYCGYAGEVGLLPIGIDWVTLDYNNPCEVGAAIAKLISIFCGIINPDHVVLYGNFLSEAYVESVLKEIPPSPLRTIFPSVNIQSDLDHDIITGLIALAVAAYQNEPGANI